MIEENETANTSKTDKPWLWKKGFCPNPSGRPKGKSMKDYVREYLTKMSDDERDEWLDGMNKDKIWAMAEGNPVSNTDVTTNGESINGIDPTDPKMLAMLKEINDARSKQGT